MKRKSSISETLKRRAACAHKTPKERVGAVVSTGSTLLDLAISGGIVRGGGIPGGILVEVFGPSQTGKTVLLCEIAGAVQRSGGKVLFNDPEARLDKQFAKMFDLDVNLMDYETPDKIPEVFSAVRNWEPDGSAEINGVFADSLAALSTDMEMGEGGDKTGMRRAKEFSEELRKTCRILKNRNILMVCSNQIRQNVNSGPWGPSYKSPGGEAVPFYASLRLRCKSFKKLVDKKKIKGKEHSRVVGIKTEIEVYKSSIWRCYRTAPLYIIFDYGIDDIRANLQFLKDVKRASTYQIGDDVMGQSLNQAVQKVEERGLEEVLKNEVIDVWMEIEEKFEVERKGKKR